METGFARNEMSLAEKKGAIEKNLKEQILQPWMKMIDLEKEIIYPSADRYWNIDESEDLSCILLARILWTYSRAVIKEKCIEYRKSADLAYSLLRKNFQDPLYGGYYWSVNSHGRVVEDRKHIYAQAFSLYGLSEYARINPAREVLQQCSDLFDLLIKHGQDSQYGGFIECRARNWAPLKDQRLSSKDLNVDKSMNTNLHVMEALSNYYDIRKEDQIQFVLRQTVDAVVQNIIDKDNGHFKLFFDMDWSVVGKEVSYGHDIEGIWLIWEAIEKLQDYPEKERVKALLLKMGQRVLEEGIDPEDGACFNEGSGKSPTQKDKDWWPQAEAMVGFLQLFLLGGELYFWDAAERLWAFIEKNLVDYRFGGWFWSTDEEGRILNDNKAGPWQCPYHNARSCWEALDRLKQIHINEKDKEII